MQITGRIAMTWDQAQLVINGQLILFIFNHTMLI